MKWGTRSNIGTDRGKWRKDGSNIVSVGTVRYKRDRRFFRRFCKSRDLNITDIANKKLDHSKTMFVTLKMLMGKP